MANVNQAWRTSGVSFAALILLAGCSGRTTYESPAAPEAAPPPPPPLAGGSQAPSDNTGLLGGPTEGARAANGLITYRRADGVQVTAMRPIANPEDMSPQARGMVYGKERSTKPAQTQARIAAPRAPATQRVHDQVWAQARPKSPAAPRPTVIQPPRPASVAPIVRPAPKAVAPAVTAAAAMTIPVPAPLPIPSDAKLAGMQAQLAPLIAQSSSLAAPTNLPTGQSGQARLTLPADLLSRIQREAPKHGLAAAARSAEVNASLIGDGYEITPNQPQTVRLQPGQAPIFNWQVTRTVGAAGPLHADVQSVLTGARSPMAFSLASIGADLGKPNPPAAVKGTWLGPLDATGQRTVFGAFLVLVALFIASLIARNAGKARRSEERRRRFSALTEYSVTPSPEPEPYRETGRDAQSAQRRHNDQILGRDGDPE